MRMNWRFGVARSAGVVLVKRLISREEIMKKTVAMLFACIVITAGFALAQGQRGGRGPAQPIDIAGTWTGTWSNFNPAQASSQPNVVCAKLDAKVALVNGVWEAT